MLRPPSVLCRFAFVALPLVAALLGTARAQVIPPSSSPPFSTAGQFLRPNRVTSSGLVLEGALDPQTYIVGPGDEFDVSIGGAVPRQFSASVSADGILSIPEAGSFNAAGRTLAAVRSEARAALQRRFANVSTNVSLAVPRQFYVHVSGAVPDPGRHVVNAVARVDDALASAVPSGTTRDLGRYSTSAGREDRWPALRNVIVMHEEGASESVDLVRYFVTGDVAYNPYLRDGDAVNLTTFSPAQEGVSVNGSVPRPGVYDLRPGDTVGDLLVAAGNSDAGTSAAVVAIRLTREGAPSRTLTVAEAARTPVQPRDQIFAVGADLNAGYASVAGAVRYPGVYPIQIGQTTLGQLVETAGGLREGALIRGAYLLRPSAMASRGSSDSTADDALTAADTAQAFPLGDLDFFSRRFLAQELERVPTVTIDLERALRGEADVPIQDGDRLVVPLGYDGVRVLGQVLRPGYVPFVPGQTVADYVEAAGGPGPGAETVYLIEAGSNQLIADVRREVQFGDGVFVTRSTTADTQPMAQLRFQQEQAEREERRDARQARYQFVSTMIGVVSTVASLILAIAATR